MVKILDQMIMVEFVGMTTYNWEKGRKIAISNWTKIFTVIVREGKQSQPLELLDFTSFHMANATLR